MSKCLVTGGAGFIGSHIVDHLIQEGHDVVCIDNEFADNEEFYWNSNALNIKADITQYSQIEEYFKGVDYVFHLAAESRIGPAILDPISAININVLGTCTVLQLSRKFSVKRLLYSSTSSGYGNNPCPNHENQPDDCLNPYSVSKVSGEKLCSMYTNLYNLKTIIFRYFNVYGERAPKQGQYCPVTGIFLRQHSSGEALTIVGDGTQRRDFVYVGDVVRANLLAAFTNVDNNAFGKVYNVGNGDNISINSIAHLISKNVTYIPPRSGEVKENLANISRLKQTFGWQPQMTVERWIKSQL